MKNRKGTNVRDALPLLLSNVNGTAAAAYGSRVDDRLRCCRSQGFVFKVEVFSDLRHHHALQVHIVFCLSIERQCDPEL